MAWCGVSHAASDEAMWIVQLYETCKSLGCGGARPSMPRRYIQASAVESVKNGHCDQASPRSYDLASNDSVWNANSEVRRDNITISSFTILLRRSKALLGEQACMGEEASLYRCKWRPNFEAQARYYGGYRRCTLPERRPAVK